MKLTKILATLAFAGVLTACSQAENAVSSVASGVKSVGESTVSGVKSVGESAVSGVKAVGESAMSAVTPAQQTFETAAFFCDVQGKKNQVVSITYAFANGNPDNATVSIARKVVGAELKFDTAFKDGARFVNGNNVLNLDYGFSEKTASKTDMVMFTRDNQILAKNCKNAK